MEEQENLPSAIEDGSNVDANVGSVPREKFDCSVCDSSFHEKSQLKKHLDKHLRHDKQCIHDFHVSTLKNLPVSSPSGHYYASLQGFLQGIYESERLRDAPLRNTVAETVMMEIRDSGIDGISVQFNGSSLSGFGLAHVSELDFSFQVDGVAQVKKTLHDIYSLLESKSDLYQDLYKDLARRAPLISFKVSGLPCILLLKNEKPNKTSLLLREYWKMDHRVRILGVVVRYWAYSLGITNHKDAVVPTHTFIILLIHYLIYEGLVPCILEWGPPDEELDVQDEGIQEKLKSWKTNCTKSLAELWIGFLKYYSVDFDVRDHVATIRSSTIVTKVEKQWKYKRLSVEEPYALNKNLLRVVHNTVVFEFIHKCFQFSCRFFGIPETTKGPLFRFLQEKEENIARKMEMLSIKKDAVPRSDMITIEEAEERLASLRYQDILLEWNPDKFSNHSKMPLICSVCTNEGHTQNTCPDEVLPVVENLPPLPSKNLTILEKFFCQNMEFLKVTPNELLERNTILNDIMGFIRRYGYPTAVLTVYGSSENGFGFKKSDLDMCLTFEDQDINDLEPTEVINDVAKIIQRMSGIVSVRPITSAKVPIIKFFHLQTGLEGDISLYNCLASENTRLLRTYASIDIRLQTLGYNLKLFIKACDVGDASRGSLSSYTCVIMAIYYLQHCKPPILPVLQELHDPKIQPPTVMFEGYDIWFNSSPSDIKDWQNRHPKNTTTSAELFIGFLDFFGRQFDSENDIVSIRRHQVLKKLDKMWNTDCLAVEDPFELNRNLGGRLTRRMHLFIKKCFIKGYERFATPTDKKYRFRDFDKYYFNASNMGIGKAPTDRGCHICGGIWHVARECPRKIFTKRRKTPKKQPHDEKHEGGYLEEPNGYHNDTKREDAPEFSRERFKNKVFNNSAVREAPILNQGGGRGPKSSSSPHQVDNSSLINEGLNQQLLQMSSQKEFMGPPPLGEEFSGAPRFIQGAICAKDLERSFESVAASPRIQGRPIQPPTQMPPPGYFSQQNLQQPSFNMDFLRAHLNNSNSNPGPENSLFNHHHHPSQNNSPIRTHHHTQIPINEHIQQKQHPLQQVPQFGGPPSTLEQKKALEQLLGGSPFLLPMPPPLGTLNNNPGPGHPNEVSGGAPFLPMQFGSILPLDIQNMLHREKGLSSTEPNLSAPTPIPNHSESKTD